MNKGYTGISFPFRIGNKGGIVLSTTDRTNIPHITESIQQILGTSKRERLMLPEFGGSIDSQIFEINDESSHTLIKYQIVEALSEYEPRIEVEREDITFSVKDNILIAHIKFRVISYQNEYNINVELGGK